MARTVLKIFMFDPSYNFINNVFLFSYTKLRSYYCMISAQFIIFPMMYCSCILEINKREGDLLAAQITVEQLQERDSLLSVQNEMLKVGNATPNLYFL